LDIFCKLFLNVEWAHIVPELGFTATNARMASPDRPVSALVPLYYWTVVVGFRPSATNLIQAPSLGGAFISKLFYEFLVFKVAPSWAVVGD